MNPKIILFFVIITPILAVILLFYYKKQKALRQTRSLSVSEKTRILNELTNPLGYEYNSSQDLFLSIPDAPQKLFGYHTFYDYAAMFFHMVFDYETIYFNYNERTWLIEFWKGQYGICSGCEVGVYYNETIVTPDEYKTTHYDAVAPQDMPLITLQLSHKDHSDHVLGLSQKRHWWSTLFRLPFFSLPDKLQMDVTIRFKNYEMLSAFLKGFVNTLPQAPYLIRGLTFSFPFYTSNRQYRWTQRIIRRLALSSCHFLYNVFSFITRTFTNGGDKIIYLYYYLPFTIRLLFHLPQSLKKEL